MSTPAQQAGERAARNGQNKPYSHNWNERQDINKGWKAGGGK